MSIDEKLSSVDVIDYSPICGEVIKSTWALYISDEDGYPIESTNIGTAFSVSPDGLFLTAKHVTDKFSKYGEDDDKYLSLTQDTPNSNNEHIMVVGLDIQETIDENGEDVAILSYSNEVPAKIGSFDHLSVKTKGDYSPMGKPVVAFGYPINKSNNDGIWEIIQRSTPGNIMSIKSHREHPVYEINALFHPGLSGGPLISLSDGSVIGVVHSREKYMDSHGFGNSQFPAHISRAKTLIDSDISDIGTRLETIGVISSS